MIKVLFTIHTVIVVVAVLVIILFCMSIINVLSNFLRKRIHFANQNKFIFANNGRELHKVDGSGCRRL